MFNHSPVDRGGAAPGSDGTTSERCALRAGLGTATRRRYIRVARGAGPGGTL